MLSNKKWLVVVALLAMVVLVLGACAPATPTTTEAPAPASEAAPAVTQASTTGGGGGTTASSEPVKVGMVSDMSTTNYWAYLDTEASVWNQYVMVWWYPALLGFSDQKFDVVPGVSDGLPTERVQEGDKWTITAKIKPGLTWSDGEPLTANDVVFTATTAQTLRLGGAWTGQYFPLAALEKVEAVDDLTVKYTFSHKPGLSEWEYGTGAAPILPAHYWQPFVDKAAPGIASLKEPAADAPQEEKDKYATDLAAAQQVLYQVTADDKTVVFGPFKFNQWQAGAFAQNDMRDDYYFSGTKITEFANGGYTEEGKFNYSAGDATGDKTLEYTYGPNFPNVIYNIYADQNAAVLALEKGDIDYIYNPNAYSGGLMAKVNTMENTKVEKNPQNGWRYLAFNIRKPKSPMAYTAFRQAVATLIDREFITNTILQGLVQPVNSVVPQANGAWYTPDVPKWGYKEDGTGMTRAERVDAAVKLLTDAGFTFEGGVAPVFEGAGSGSQVVTGGNLIMPDGTPVSELVLLAPSPGYDSTRSTAAIWVESWLSEFGIPTKAKLVAFNTILDSALSGPSDKWDMFILGVALNSIYPVYYQGFYLSTDTGNSAFYNDPDMDKLILDFNAATDLAEAKKLSDQIQVKALTDVPYVMLFTNPIADVHHTNLDWAYVDVLDGLSGGSGYLGGMHATVSQ
jgi:ABC-type transport system substrate-binding protein